MNGEPVFKTDLDREALEFFFNSVDHLFAILDSDGAVVLGNGAFRRFVAPAAAADTTNLSAYLTEECRDVFAKELSKLNPNETITELKLSMRIGWDIRLVKASISRSMTDGYFFSALDITNKARLDQRRKETDDALAQLELLVGIGRWTISKNKTAFWSPGMFRMFGLEEGSKPLTFAEYAQMMSPEDLKKLTEAFTEGKVVRSSTTVVCTFNCPDGQTRIIEFAGSPLHGEDGTVEGVSGVALNKTNSVKKIQSSIQTETSAKAFLEHAPMGIAIIDLEGKISLVNEALSNLLDVSELHLLGSNVVQLWENTPEEISKSVSDGLTGQTTELKHLKIPLENGNQWIDWTCAPWDGADGEICGAICVVKDVSQSVREKRSTEASLARMEYGLSLSSMMVWEIDLIKKSVQIEGDWKPFFKTKPTLAELSHSLFKLAHPDDKPRVTKAWKQHVCAGAPVHLSYRKENAVGREIWVSVASRQEADEDGKPLRMIGSMRDITVSQKADFLTEQVEDKLENKYRLKSSLIGEVGKTVSKQIDSLLDLTQSLQRTTLDKEQYSLLRLMNTSAEIAGNAVANIDRYVDIHAQNKQSKKVEFNIKSLVESCVSSSSIESSIVEAVFSENADEKYNGAEEQISEALVLLIKEIQRLARTGEAVIVETEIDNSGEGLCILTFDVKFSKPAMPYSDSILIELDNAEQEGLSMAIIHDFVEKLKGTVFFEKDGERTTRILTEFPITQEFERNAPVGRTGPMGDKTGLKILVADDNPLNRRVLELLANQMGLDVSFVENGEEALNAIKDQHFDVVIMDTQMPIMSGISAIKSIRAWEKSNSYLPMPIIAAIPNMSFSKVREAMSVGANDCIAKPISQEDLVTHLSELDGGGWEVSSKKIAASG